MNRIRTEMSRWSSGLAFAVLTLTLTAVNGGRTLSAQEAAKPETAATGSGSVQLFYLKNVGQSVDGSEIVNALRTMLPGDARVYFMSGVNAVAVRSTPDQLALAQRLIDGFDKPKKTFRVTYTVTELENGKLLGTQHFTVIVVAGQRTTLKQGNRVPVVTGSLTGESTRVASQVTYLDVGLSFDTSLDDFANGLRLRSKVEQSSIAEEASGVGRQDPVVRQTVLEGTSFLVQGKPLILGGLDIPGTTRHLDIEAVFEPVR